nr:cytochrome P450 6QA1 [Phenacoccus solenopsis]
MIFYIVLAIFVLLLYCYLTYPFNYWKNLNVASAPAVLFLGNISDFVFGKKHISLVYNDVYESFPDEPYVGILELRSPNLIIRDPTLAHRILVKDFHHFHDRGMDVDEDLDPLNAHLVNLAGTRWKTTRSKLMPAFSSGKLKHMYPLIEDCVRELDAYLDNESNDKREIDVREAMAKFSTDVIGRCAFGLDFNTLKDPESAFRRIGKKIFVLSYGILVRICLRLINPKLLKYIRIKSVSVEVEQFFFNLLYDTIQSRKYDTNDRMDFLQLMCSIQEQEKDKELDDENKLSDTLLVANMFVFFAGGFETTATTLSYCLYELALNPQVQEKARMEIENVQKAHNGSFDYDALNEMNYLELIIMETMRKYAPIPLASRICTQPYNIPGTNIILREKQRVTIPIHSYHHDPKYFPDPEKFYPERFKNYEKLAYLPFGDGPRICIGLRFAKLEVKSCLARLLAKYTFTPCSQTKIPIEIKARSIFLTPKDSIVLSVSKISD